MAAGADDDWAQASDAQFDASCIRWSGLLREKGAECSKLLIDQIKMESRVTDMDLQVSVVKVCGDGGCSRAASLTLVGTAEFGKAGVGGGREGRGAEGAEGAGGVPGGVDEGRAGAGRAAEG
jgi:hypothetical protein